MKLYEVVAIVGQYGKVSKKVRKRGGISAVIALFGAIVASDQLA